MAILGLLLLDIVLELLVKSLVAGFLLFEGDLDEVRDLEFDFTEEMRSAATIFYCLSSEIVEPPWMFERLSAGIFFFETVLEPGLSSRSGISCRQFMLAVCESLTDDEFV